MGYDLHVHSTYSDGSIKPSELIVKAVTAGLAGIALTDHDSIAGIAEAVLAARKYDYTFIPGIELTTDYGRTEVHVLGYDFNLTHKPLLQKLERVVEARNARAKLIIKKLKQHRLPLSWEKVRAQTSSRFIGRAHIFRALVKSGLVAGEHRQAAFEYYLGKNGVAYVPHQEIETKEAIQLINNAGGVSVLAHPGRMGNDLLIPELVESGLKGLEVYYPAHTPEQTVKYLETAGKYDLLITGGSDYHGAFSQNKLGDAQVDKLPWGKKAGF